jgi:YidC/Oxa1 family membrane protein insertase
MIAFLAVIIFLIGYQVVLKKYGPSPQPPQQQQQAQAPQQAQPPAPAASVPVPAAANAKGKEAAAPAVATKQAAAESEIVVENDLYKITFTNRGGQVKSWILKKYSDDKGNPLDLVHQPAAQQFGYPLSLWTYDENLRKKMASVLYVATDSGTGPTLRTVTFEYADGDTTVRKSFTFDESYVVKVAADVTHNGASTWAMPSWPSGFGDDTVATSYAAQTVDFALVHPGKKWDGLRSNPVERVPAKGVSGGNTMREPFFWAGTNDQYFAAIFLPDDPGNDALVTLHNSLQVPKNSDKPDPNDTMKVEILGTAVGHTSGHTSLRLFAGPKDIRLLDEINATPAAGVNETPNLGSLVDLGTFSVFVRPLFAWLRWTYRQVGNWGLAIIVVTIVINIALLPLRLSSMKSALKTAKIQPLMQNIKDKYKKYDMRDPRRQQMNQEIAALMKEHGVNPAGGCLPLVIQLPFLWAFYSMLGNTIELRHAHFLYIHDLSAPDPFHVLPILIVISTFLVQRMTPQGGMDPQQQKMMNLMMPLMLGFISMNLSSGLCLYWVIGNIVAMLLQVFLNHTDLGRQQRELVAKRARKQALKA